MTKKPKTAKKTIRIKDLQAKKDPRAGRAFNGKAQGHSPSPDGINLGNHNETFLRG